MAVAQWDATERLLGLFTDAIAAAGVEPPIGQPVGLSRERLARDEELCRLFEGAGLADVRVDTDAFVEPMRGTDELWEGVLGGSVSTRVTVLAQPPDVQRRIRDALARLARPARRPALARGDRRSRLPHRVGPTRLAHSGPRPVNTEDSIPGAGGAGLIVSFAGSRMPCVASVWASSSTVTRKPQVPCGFPPGQTASLGWNEASARGAQNQCSLH